MYDVVKARVRDGASLTESIHCLRGVKQGDVCSKIKGDKHGTIITSTLLEIFILLFAGDILLSETTPGLQNQLNILYRSSERWQLKSESKIPPLGIRILPHLEKSKINLNLIDDASSLDITPWTRSNATVLLDFFKNKQTNKQNKKQTHK